MRRTCCVVRLLGHSDAEQTSITRAPARHHASNNKQEAQGGEERNFSDAFDFCTFRAETKSHLLPALLAPALRRRAAPVC